MVGSSMYSPSLMGIYHNEKHLEEVVAKILSMNPRPISVGLESNLHVNDEIWSRLGARLEASGVKVVPLLTDAFYRRWHKELYGKYSTNPIDVSEFLAWASPIQMHQELKKDKIESRISELISFVLPRVVLREANKKKPELIVCGQAHAPILRKSLGIPKARCFLVGVPNVRRMRLELIRVRRFERTRNLKRLITKR